jgi:hypothetical protein
MQDPPAISLHSLQDGQVILALSVDTNTAEGNAIHLDGMWWFREETKSLNSSNIPDIFKRNDIIVRLFRGALGLHLFCHRQDLPIRSSSYFLY